MEATGSADRHQQHRQRGSCIDPESLPSRININELIPRKDNATYSIILHFSTRKSDGNRIRRGAITLYNNVAYPTLEGAQSIIAVFGCGVNKINVELKDNWSSYQMVNVCLDQPAARKELQTLHDAAPCIGYLVK